MKIYTDSEFRCHTTNSDGIFKEVETDYFDGMCATLIEGYCYEEGNGYTSIYPWKDFNELDAAQREYERQKLAEYEALIDELYAEVTE